ncbi:hypothetical protein Tco_0825633 [Tanacetum coccineum]
MEDTLSTLIPKVSTTMWFKPIPESEIPATPEPEWASFPQLISREPEHNWAKCIDYNVFKVPEEKMLQRKTLDMGLSVPFQYSRKSQPSAQDRQDQSSHSSQHVDKKPGVRKSFVGDWLSSVEYIRGMETRTVVNEDDIREEAKTSSQQSRKETTDQYWIFHEVLESSLLEEK